MLASVFNFTFSKNFDSKIRFINDSHDRENYYARGSWILEGKRPYIDVFSEYPQLATYFFAVPHIILTVIHDSMHQNHWNYYFVFSLIMVSFL